MSINLFNYQNRFGENTNFGFSGKEKVEYLQSSTGKNLGYQLFSENSRFKKPKVSEVGDGKPSTDFALMERQFSRYGGLSFLGREKVESLSDVAYLFKSLESESIEHTFLLYRFKDDSYLVQHLSSGGLTSAVVDLRLLVGHVHKLRPESITLVHNHPSGQLISSRQDQVMLERLRVVFEKSPVKVENGIILNLRSGKYLEFGLHEHEDQVRAHQKPSGVEQVVTAYSFDKHLFEMNYQPLKVSSPEQCAAYLSTQKFGLSDKTESLILNNANEVVGKFVLPQHKQYEKLVELLTIYGGTSVILFGNHLSSHLFQKYRAQLQLIGFSALDGVRFESGNYRSLLNQAKIELKEELVAHYEKETKKLAGAMEMEKKRVEKTGRESSPAIESPALGVVASRKDSTPYISSLFEPKADRNSTRKY